MLGGGTVVGCLLLVVGCWLGGGTVEVRFQGCVGKDRQKAPPQMNKIKIDNGNAPLPCPSHGRGFLFVPSMTGGYALLAPVCNLSPLFPSVTHSGAYWPIPISIPMNRKKKDRVIIPLIAPPPHTLAAKSGVCPLVAFVSLSLKALHECPRSQSV